MKTLTLVLMVTVVLGLFDEEFEALKKRITALEEKKLKDAEIARK